MATDPERIYMKDGRVIDVPAGTDPRELSYLKTKYADQIMDDPTLAGAIGTGLLNVPRGFAQTVALMGRGAAQMVPGEGAFERGTQAALGAIQDTYDPRYADSFIAQLGQGIGSIGAFALPAIASGGTAIPGTAAAAGAGVLSGVGEQATRIDHLQDQGVRVSAADEVKASILGGVIGASEALPVGRIAGRIRGAFGRGAAEQFVNRGAGALAKDLTNQGLVRSAIGSGLAEGTQEITAGLGQNIVARTIYDPNAEIAPSMSEFTVGGAAGAIFDIAGSVAARRAGRISGGGDYFAEQLLRDQRLRTEGPLRVDEAYKDETDAKDRGEEFDPETFYSRKYDVKEVEPGLFAVVDDNDQPLSKPQSFREAEEKLAQMTDTDADRIIAAEAIRSARDQGLEGSPEAVQNIYFTLLAESREVPLTTLAGVVEGGEGSGADVALRDPQSPIAVKSFRRGFNEAENFEVSEVLESIGLGEAQLGEAEGREPTVKLKIPQSGTVELKPTRTKKNGGSYMMETNDGGQYRITKYGSLGWRISPESNPTLALAFAGSGSGTYAATLKQAQQEVFAIRARENRVRTAQTGKRQRREIDRLISEREDSLAAARKKLDKLQRDVASDPNDQPRLDLISELHAEGRLSVTPEEARVILGNDGDYDNLLFAMSGMTVSARRNILRSLKDPAARTKAGKPKARTKADHLTYLEDLFTQWQEEALVQNNGQLPTMTPDGNVTAAMINFALKSRGWSSDMSDGRRGWMSKILGRDIRTMSELTKGEMAYVLTQAASLEMGDVVNPITLPDPTPRKRGTNGSAYTNADINAALSLVRAGMEEGKTAVNRHAVVGSLVEGGLTTAQGKQIVSNLVRSGRIRETGGKDKGGVAHGLKFVSDTPGVATGTVSSRRLGNIAQRLAERSGRAKPTDGQLAIAEEIELAALSINQNLAAQSQAAADAQGKRVDPIAVKQEIEAAMDRVIDGAADIDLIQNKIMEIITDPEKLGLNLSEESKARFEVLVVRDATEMAKALGPEAVNLGAMGAYVAAPNAPVRIAFNLAKIPNLETKTLREIVADLEPTAVWETTRLFFDNDFFTAPEKRAFRLAAEKLIVAEGPNTGKTYLDQARIDMAAGGIATTNPAYDELLTETATAAMASDFRTRKLNKITSPVAKGGIGKVLSFMRSMAALVKDPSVNQTLDLLAQIEGGNIGSRGAGLSNLNLDRDAPIRSLRETAMLGGRQRAQAMAPPTEPDDDGGGSPPPGGDGGVSPPTDASGAEAATGAAPVATSTPNTTSRAAIKTPWQGLVEAGAVTDEQQAEYDAADLDGQEAIFRKRLDEGGLPSEEVAENEAYRDDSIKETLESGGVPLHGKDSSPVAVKAYRNSPPEGTRTEARPQVRYRLSRANESPDPWGGKYVESVKYEQPDLTMGEVILTKLKTFEFYDLLAGDDGKAFFDKKRREFRSAILDGRNEAELLDERYGKYVRDELGIEILADQEAATMLRRADQVAQIFAEAIKGGRVRYVKGTEKDENGNDIASTDPNAGHFLIDRTPLVTASGRKFDSITEVFDSMMRNGEAGDVHVDRYMVAKRMLEIQATAKWAQDQLNTQTLGDADEIKAMQGWIDLAAGDFPGGMTMESAAEMVLDTEAPNSGMEWIVEAAEGLIAWNDSLLQMSHDAGLLDDQQLEAWKGKAYVSFSRKHDRAGYDIATGKKRERTADATRTVSIKEKFLGNSDAHLDMPLLNRLMEDSSTLIHDAMINTGYNRVVRNLVGLGMGQTVQERSDGGRYIRYYQNGEEKLFRIDVEKFPEAESLIKSMEFSGEDFITGMVKALPMFSDILRQGVTRMPDFMIRNLFKDSLSVSVTAGAGRPLVGTFSRFGASAANMLTGKVDEDFELAKRLGIALEVAGVNDGNRYESRIKAALSDKQAALRGSGEFHPGRMILKAWDGMGDLSRRSDTATRMEVYHEVLEATGNEAEAVKQALEIINYGRRGSHPVWRLATSAIPFLNARAQGLDVLYRSATGRYTAHRLTPEGKRKAANDIMRGTLTRGMILMGITAAYYMAVNDEEWYKNLRDEVKDDYWIIPTGGDHAIKIPAPFEVGLIFKTMPEMMMRVMNEDGYDGEQAGQAMRRAALQSTMFNPVPQILSPMLDVMRNYNSFTRSEIVPTYMEDGLPYQERRTNNTSSTAQMLASMASAIPGLPDIDPMRMEYLVNGYLGSAGTLAISLMDNVTRSDGVRDIFNAIPLLDDVPTPLGGSSVVGTRADFRVGANLPFVGAVTQDLARGGGYQQDFYELRREVDSAVAAINRAKKEGRELDFRAYQNEYGALMDVRGTVRRLDRYIVRWRERQQKLLQTDMPDSQKRERLKDLEAERDEQLAIIPFLRDVSNR